MYVSMELSQIIFSLGIIILLIAVVAILMYMQIRSTSILRMKRKLNEKNGLDSTYYLDEGEDEKRCEICYGAIGDEPLAVCKCGKKFHDACAQPTVICPYCNSQYSEMEIRNPIRARCPVCGRFVTGSICECGAVLPRKDNTFLCSCGNRVDVKNPTCRKCGAVYETVTMQAVKRK